MRLLLSLLLCLRCCSPASAKARTGAPRLNSLRVGITFTPTPGPGPPRCGAVVEVQGEPCFSYDCQSKEVRPVSVQGQEVAAPLREHLRDILEDLTAKLRDKLLDLEPADSRGSDEWFFTANEAVLFTVVIVAFILVKVTNWKRYLTYKLLINIVIQPCHRMSCKRLKK